jgi:hypothetical protein
MHTRALSKFAPGDVTMGKNLNAKGLAAIGLCFLKQGKLAEAQAKAILEAIKK